MHVLTYVIAILLVLASMTYARLQSYRSFAAMEASFVHYMEKTETKPINTLAESTYNTIQVQVRDSKQQFPKAEGTAYLSLHLIVNSEERNKHPKEYQETRTLLKQLIIQQYGNQTFFKELAEKHPQFLDEMIDGLQQSAERSPELISSANISSISRLPLNSPEIQNVLFLMLEGLEVPEAATQTSIVQQQPMTLSPQELEDTDDELEAAYNEKNSDFKPGYNSLKNTLTLTPTTKIRVFLASPELLMAIYDDPYLVEKIRETRSDLYRQVKKEGGITTEVASEEFKKQFEGAGKAPAYAEILSFAVSRTNPKNYEN